MTLATLRYLGLGIGATISLAIVAIAVSAVFGMFLAVVRLYAWGPLRGIAAAYALIIRGIPLLILLIAAYFGLPYVGISMPIYPTVILVMGLYFGAYMARCFAARSAPSRERSGRPDAASDSGAGRTSASSCCRRRAACASRRFSTPRSAW